MKKAIALLFALLVIAIANAQQFKFSPKWQAGQSTDLEYIYSNHERKNNGEHEFDTVYADMKLKFVKEDDYFYFFDWWFLSYYQDTTFATTTTEKLTGPIIAKCVTQLPIKIRIEKQDWEMKVLNKAVLDSVRSIVLKEWMANAPKKDENGFMEGMLEFLVASKMEKNVYGIINDYFAIYSNNKLVLNRKLSLDEMKGEEGAAEGLSKMFGDVEGHALLSDENPMYYNFHYEMKMDMSEMMNSFGEIAKAFDKDSDKKKKGKKTEPAKAELPIDTTQKAYSTKSSDIKVRKSDMVFESAVETTSMDGSKTLLGQHSKSVKMLRIKQ